MLDCSVNTISRWENNKYSPTVDELNKISEVLNVHFLEGANELTDSVTRPNRDIVDALEDIRLDLIRIERKKNRVIKISVVVIVMLAVFIIAIVFAANWRNPNETSDSIVVEYIDEEGG